MTTPDDARGALDRARACDDCGEDIPANQRRHRCPRCDQMVCHWCWHHVHQLADAGQLR